MWTLVDNDEQRTAFRSLLMECEDYVPVIEDVMTALADRPGMVGWNWNGRGFRLALAYQVRTDDAWIMVGVPGPEGTPAQWCRTMIEKLREDLDALGIKDWFARQEDDYKSEHMAEFADGIDRFCHEFKGEQRSGTTRRIQFRREVAARRLDSRFDGPGKDRPPRTRRPRPGRREE